MKLQTIFSGEHFSDRAKEAKFQPPWWAQILLFVLVFSISGAPQSIVSAVMVMTDYSIENMDQIQDIIMELTKSDPIMIAQLLSTVLTAIIVIIYCKLIERRSLYSMGFVKKNAVPSYLIGLASGFAMFSATLLISYLAGAAKYVGTDVYNVGIYVLYCVGWLIQGAEEEILCRGYFMPSLSTKLPLWAAVLISSLFFSLMHPFNVGFNLIVLVNLTLTGIMFAVFAIRFNNLWVSCAIHSIWNLVQGNFYGLPVSGMYNGPSVFSFELAENMDLWTGGVFGLEGSLCETIVMVIAIVAVIFIPKKKKNAEISA
ncbi:MAG: CPBP family intramembrane metalloprotease [Ruminococcaceae bacterium]|nr:CPBP family intramembrane metalloprotease [Oscillospiraceae bacterium]